MKIGQRKLLANKPRKGTRTQARSTKGYELKVLNFNPHSTLRYNRVYAAEK
jgi:hypothetical protein